MLVEARSRTLGRALLTNLLAGLAAAGAELVLAEPGRPLARSLTIAALMTIATIAIAAWLVHDARRGGRLAARPWALLALAIVFLGPPVWELARFTWSGRWNTGEVVMLASLRNLSLGLAALATRSSHARLSALVSLFVMLIAVTLADGPAVLVVFGGFAIAGGAWLMAECWARIHRVDIGTGPWRVSWSALGSLALMLLLGVTVMAVGPKRAAAILAEIMPSSGGTSWDNEDARSGVGDGPNEVKGGDDPRSVGFSESDKMLETDRPSLFDAFSDIYGEPFRREKFERMIAIGADKVVEKKERPTEDLKAGRQFQAVRQTPTSRRPAERPADALVYVQGPTPVHLPLMAYDQFDGRDWTEAPELPYPLRLKVEKTSWLAMPGLLWSIHAGAVRHRIKIGRLDTSPLPVPAHLERFRIKDVDRPDFFAWAQAGIVKMAERTIPAGTMIDTESRTVEPRGLLLHDWTRSHPPQTDGIDPKVVALARSWGEREEWGWPRVQSVVQSLRAHAAHDRTATVPEDCPDAVAHFLLRSRRGPDYLFASSAVVLLKALGYRGRLVSGLYAAPERYDPRSKHVLVGRESVHFWAEVQLMDGRWVAIEPTPGYDIMPPARSWLERLTYALGDGLRLLRRHPWSVPLALALGGLVFALRDRLANGVATLIWAASPTRDVRRRALGTLRLLDVRCRLAGRARPPSQSPRRWYLTSQGPRTPWDHDIERWVALMEWSLYAPGDRASPIDAKNAAVLCGKVVATWTLQRSRQTFTLGMERSLA